MYAAFNNQAIVGVGNTAAAARKNAEQWLDKPRQAEQAAALQVAEMTPALAADVTARGGAIAFDKLADGRIGTPDERDAEEE